MRIDSLSPRRVSNGLWPPIDASTLNGKVVNKAKAAALEALLMEPNI